MVIRDVQGLGLNYCLQLKLMHLGPFKVGADM